MLNAKLAPVLLLIGVTASVWGCGDDDPAPTPGTSGKGGAAGSGGKGGAGSGGKGGAAGSGGATGGASGKGGAAGKGGTAGTSGTSGTGGGGTAGTGGSAGTGNQGGEGGIDTGGQGGAGGEGGGGMTALTIEQACAEVCADQVTVSCTYDPTCESQCMAVADATGAPAEYLAMMTCQAENVTTADYENYCGDFDPGSPILAPVPTTQCEDEICAWACVDFTYMPVGVYIRCGC